MTTAENIDREVIEAGTYDQARDGTHELSEDELVLVCGGDLHCHIHPN